MGKWSFWKLENVLSLGGSMLADSQGVQLNTLSFYWCRKRILDFFFLMGKWPFWNLENVLSPGGSLLGRLWRGPIVFTFHFIGVGNGTGGFKITIFRRPFWKLENVLSPGGSLLSRLLRGPIVFNLCFIGVGNVYWTFFSLWGNGLF